MQMPGLLDDDSIVHDYDYATDEAVSRCLVKIEKAQRAEQLQGKVVGMLWTAAHS